MLLINQPEIRKYDVQTMLFSSQLGERCSNSSDCASRFCSTMKLTGECGLSGNVSL